MAARPNPFDDSQADPAVVAQVEGSYTTMRGYVTGAALGTIAHGLSRASAPRIYHEVYVTIMNSLATGQNTVTGIIDAYATAMVELARIHNEREGVTPPEPLPEWPDDEDPREHGRKRATAFLAALQRLSIDHQMVIDTPEVPITWLRDIAEDGGGQPLAAQLHWCERLGHYAAREPFDHAGYQITTDEPWWVPDGH